MSGAVVGSRFVVGPGHQRASLQEQKVAYKHVIDSESAAHGLGADVVALVHAAVAADSQASY